MHHRQSLGRAALAAVLLSLVLVVAAAAPGAGGSKAAKPQAVKSKSDTARAKLDQKLQNLVAQGSTKRVFVYATVKPDAAANAAALMSGSHVAGAGDISLVVGSVRVAEATKLAGLPGVVSVKLVQLKQTASPLGIPEPSVNQTPSTSAKKSLMDGPEAQGGSVLGRSGAEERQLRQPEAARRPRCQDAQVRRCLEPRVSPAKVRPSASSTAAPIGGTPIS